MRRRAVLEIRRLPHLRDFRKTYKPEQLIGIGAVSLSWNEIEQLIDVAVGYSLRLPIDMFLSVTSRIAGFEGKIGLIKEAARIVWQMSDDRQRLIAATLGRLEEYKRYRDGLIHAKILSPAAETALTTPRKGKEDEVVVTEAAINGVCDRLIAARAEVRLIILFFVSMECLLEPDRTNKAEIESQLRIYETRLRRRQMKREALPPLPRFPRHT